MIFIKRAINDLAKTEPYFKRYTYDIEAFAMAVASHKNVQAMIETYKGYYTFKSTQLTPHYSRGDSDYELSVGHLISEEKYTIQINYSDY